MRGVFILRLEEAEHRHVVAVRVVVQAIVDRGDASDDAIAARGEQQIDVGVLEERVLRGRQALVLGDAQRRYPMRIGGVPVVSVVDEPAEVAPVRGAANVGHGGGIR